MEILCPFNASAQRRTSDDAEARRPLADSNTRPPTKLPTGKARVQLLYEEYVHLPQLRDVWNSPITGAPVLEPCFVAAMHGIELGFLLLAEFISDPRTYVAKRPRIELVADDIARQCKLLVDVIDGELEEEDCTTSRLSLTQAFPFPDAPPTSTEPACSPGLARLIDAVKSKVGGMSQAERNSLTKVVINLSSAFTSFSRWSVGLGFEAQLNVLRTTVGLPPLPLVQSLWLDYAALVRPWVVEQTLTAETYTHAEDFFFRTVHLGTDCWAKVALARLASAQEQVAQGHWATAAFRVVQASRIMSYLGDHVMLLTSMNLRDYLLLKVELEGTSGEGSAQVKAFRKAVTELFTPLAHALQTNQQQEGRGVSPAEEETELGRALLEVYEFPDRAPGLYNYAKALEDVESGLLGGFYYKHFCLAANVIGNDARGTMKRAVSALKSSYETPIFPILDRVRSGLGAKVDAELAHVKGRMMDKIIDDYLRKPERGGSPLPSKLSESFRRSGACPFGHGSAQPAAGTSDKEQHSVVISDSAAVKTAVPVAVPETATERALRRVFTWDGIPTEFKRQIETQLAEQCTRLGLRPAPARTLGASNALPQSPLVFLDHAWGGMSPHALHAGLMDLATLSVLGNPSWDVLFGEAMPTAAGHIKRLLGLTAAEAGAHQGERGHEAGSGVNVHFGHNSHELVLRLLSSVAADVAQREGSLRPLRLLTSDTEFYSLTRQLNRLVEVGVVRLEVVPAVPAATFHARCVTAAAAANKGIDAVYVSQITYLKQQTLIPDVAAFVHDLRAALTNNNGEGTGVSQPLIIIDGYHAFAAVPTNLAAVADRCCYVGGLLKHAGCGANCAFVTVPQEVKLHPVVTGWLADPSVLAPGSEGVGMGSKVEFDQSLALQGGTPSYALPLLVFNRLMAAWGAASPPLTVTAVHEHVVSLQHALTGGLAASAAGAAPPGINLSTLVVASERPEAVSHTLVFEQSSPAEARRVVEGLAEKGILVDCRNRYVRIGMGANHTRTDVDTLLACLRQ